jgi:hypothetical protein
MLKYRLSPSKTPLLDREATEKVTDFFYQEKTL